MDMMHIILQSPHTYETRAIRAASMVLDHIQVTDATVESLRQHVRKLANGALPVGSVEFVREAMRLAGIAEPDNLSYPPAASKYLHRTVRQCNAGEVIGCQFVKPVQTKLFTGFVFDTAKNRETYCEHDQVQFDAFMRLGTNDKVFVSDPVAWASEWRYYVAHGQIIGQARYDQLDDESAPTPDLNAVKACMAEMAIDHPYALDFGVLATGETALVEVNDAWSIGLYQGALKPQHYLSFLQTRWADIFATRTANA